MWNHHLNEKLLTRTFTQEKLLWIHRPTSPPPPRPADHSVYDSFTWVDTYGDPGFRYFQATARVWGLMALRLASSDVLPFDPPLQAAALEGYLDALTPPPPSPDATDGTRTGDRGGDSGDGARAASGGAGSAAAAATAAKTSAAGVVVLSEADLVPLKDAVAAFRVAADEVGSWSDPSPPSSGAADHGTGGGGGGGSDGSGSEESADDMEGDSVSPAAAVAARAFALRGAGAAAQQAPGDDHRGDGGDSGGGERAGVGVFSSAAERLRVANLNERLAMTERRFLAEQGLPGRQWFRHVLQAPGLYLGCALNRVRFPDSGKFLLPAFAERGLRSRNVCRCVGM